MVICALPLLIFWNLVRKSCIATGTSNEDRHAEHIMVVENYISRTAVEHGKRHPVFKAEQKF